jgi:hypothetical protein
MTLNVDIGHDYLAWAYQIASSIRYGVFRLEDNPRTNCITFLNKFHFAYLVIEKQVPMNTKCVRIQHYLEAGAEAKNQISQMPLIIEIQDAREKFRKLGEQVDTRGKMHKVLSVDMAFDYLINGDVVDNSEHSLSDYEKQDDIADAINMLRAVLIDAPDDYSE